MNSMDKSIRDKYTAVIGLEVHAQLLTKSKIYNTDSTEYGSLPNTNVSVITLAHPGTLPTLNKRVVEYAIKMGLACHSTITRFNIFDRKNYFYPDLPKGYQITQDRTPICVGGFITIDSKEGPRNISLHRIHIEEDAGKSMHLAAETDTLVDFNRAGVPLIEVVSNPEIKTSEEIEEFGKKRAIASPPPYLPSGPVGLCRGSQPQGLPGHRCVRWRASRPPANHPANHRRRPPARRPRAGHHV
jgi:aspartyl-tRNA(Asn)/glutamyl-tRNA(Gln) amidotransferase subunit B